LLFCGLDSVLLFCGLGSVLLFCGLGSVLLFCGLGSVLLLWSVYDIVLLWNLKDVHALLDLGLLVLVALVAEHYSKDLTKQMLSLLKDQAYHDWTDVESEENAAS
jgi:hypothetical protein